MSDELLIFIIDDSSNAAIKLSNQLNQYHKSDRLKENLKKFNDQLLDFRFKTNTGKIEKKYATVDEYIYLVTSSMQLITKKDITLLDRASESSGKLN